MNSDSVIFTEEEREALCADRECEEHGIGDNPCSLPRTKEHAVEIAQREEKEDSNTFSVKEHAEPKTATGIVEYSDE
jgi:hypothetical protein